MEGMKIMRVESHTHICTHTHRKRERKRGTSCGTMIICVVLRSMKNKEYFTWDTESPTFSREMCSSKEGIVDFQASANKLERSFIMWSVNIHSSSAPCWALFWVLGC